MGKLFTHAINWPTVGLAQFKRRPNERVNWTKKIDY